MRIRRSLCAHIAELKIARTNGSVLESLPKVSKPRPSRMQDVASYLTHVGQKCYPVRIVKTVTVLFEDGGGRVRFNRSL